MQKSKLKMTNQNAKFFEKVYILVKEIPEGKVTTYGEIARALGSRDSRKVGFALHANKDLKTPCHRVVDRNGRLAPNFAFDGPREQKRRLEAEGVRFEDEMHVDLQDSLWKIGV